jgi:hypothetical protein
LVAIGRSFISEVELCCFLEELDGFLIIMIFLKLFGTFLGKTGC